MTIRVARRDTGLTAQIVARRPLFYSEGPDPAADRPAHVRSGSSLAWVPGGLALVQDDANFLAVVDPAWDVRAIPLPRGHEGQRQFDDGRGNKRFKLDLEACLTLNGKSGPVLVAFGSGSTHRRDHVLLVDQWELPTPRVQLVAAHRFYRLLNDEKAFSGCRLNVEGAVAVGGVVRLFSRGNGAAREGIAPVNATCEVDAVSLLNYLHHPAGHETPRLTRITQYDLGCLDGVPLGFTDATRWGERILYIAAAETSSDATTDGPVGGSVLGVMEPDGDIRWNVITEPSGAPSVSKVEGVAVEPRSGQLLMVTDADNPDAAVELCRVAVTGL